METDYLLIGAGASVLAFSDTFIDHSDARLLLVDRHSAPGGHWNDAYPFVRLHQPSATYGVNSMPLGEGRRELDGMNQGASERASGPELLAYFERVMRRLRASERVTYLPLHEARQDPQGQWTLHSLLDGRQQGPVVVHRRVVDTRYIGTEVPSTRPPRYTVAQGVTCIPPNALPQPRAVPPGYVVIGAGKTGVDACLWLLENGVSPERIRWVRPREAWFHNRRFIECNDQDYVGTFNGFATQNEALAQAGDPDDALARLAQAGLLLRLDEGLTPTMYHGATMSEGEVRELRRITQVIRLGHVQALEPEAMVLDGGRVPSAPGTVYVDCTARAFRVERPRPVFTPGRIDVQMLRWPAPCFSAALIAWVEAHEDGDETRNALCRPLQAPSAPRDWIRLCIENLAAMRRWGANEALMQWIVGSRLDGFSGLARRVRPDEAEKMAARTRMGAALSEVGAHLPRLMAALQGGRTA